MHFRRLLGEDCLERGRSGNKEASWEATATVHAWVRRLGYGEIVRLEIIKYSGDTLS